MAWDLLTSVYRLPADNLYVTYFAGCEELGLDADLECRDIWRNIGFVFCVSHNYFLTVQFSNYQFRSSTDTDDDGRNDIQPLLLPRFFSFGIATRWLRCSKAVTYLPRSVGLLLALGSNFSWLPFLPPSMICRDTNLQLKNHWKNSLFRGTKYCCKY